MSIVAKQTKALALAALLAMAVAFSLAFAAPSAAQADEGDLQAAGMQTQAVAALDYSGNEYKLVKEDLTSTFGMLSPVSDFTMSYGGDGKITISYTPSNKTVYAGIYLDADIADSTTWKTDNYLPINSDGSIEFSIDAKYAGKATPIAPVKRSDTSATTSAQYYMAIPSLDKIDAVYDLKVTNDEKMYVVVKAVLEDNASGQDYLTFYLNGTSYEYAFSGTQDDAVTTFDAKDTNEKWAKYKAETISSEYVTWNGSTRTVANESKYGYRIPVTIPANAKQFSIPVVAYASDFTARRLDVDLDKMTVTTGTAKDTASVSVTSTLGDAKFGEKGSIDYTGYVRPYAGKQATDSEPLSNDWVGSLTISLGNDEVYDQAYAVTFEGRPWLAEDAKAVDATEADYVKVAKDGTLVLPIVNEYDTTPKTAQLNGNIVKVKMHVASTAPYKEAGTWVDREFKLDFSNRMAATLVVSGEPLTQVMYRLYNPNSGEHFYTASAAERDNVRDAGWTYEGEAWTAPATSATPVYRLYSGTDHHYTTNKEERDWLVNDIGWKDEGVGWYSDDAEGVALYRLYNPNVDPSAPINNSGSHHYTVSAAERDMLIGVGWVDEKIAWYGVK